MALRLLLRGLAVLLALLSIGCVAYEHRVDAELRDPRAAWIERASTHERLEPATVGTRMSIAGSSQTVERGADGSLDVGSRTAVSSDGSLPAAPRTLERVERDGDIVRLPICSVRRGCVPELRVATSASNVRVLRERDVPVWFVGVQELLLSSAAIVGSHLAWSPRTSGGPLLLTVGIVLGLTGGIQVFAPAKNEQTMLP